MVFENDACGDGKRWERGGGRRKRKENKGRMKLERGSERSESENDGKSCRWWWGRKAIWGVWGCDNISREITISSSGLGRLQLD